MPLIWVDAIEDGADLLLAPGFGWGSTSAIARYGPSEPRHIHSTVMRKSAGRDCVLIRVSSTWPGH
jgi:hypothetical protein